MVMPETEKREPGVVVPMPTLPPSITVNRVDEALLTTSKARPVAAVDEAQTVSLAYGVEVPILVLPSNLEVPPATQSP